jgi:gas vesicle protein
MFNRLLAGHLLLHLYDPCNHNVEEKVKRGGKIMPNQIEGFIKGIILGSVMGAVIGILYAPQSGRKTRADIDRKAEEFLTKAKKEYEAALKKSGKAYESALRELKHMESDAKAKAGEIEEKVDELTELGKEAFHDTRGHLTKAVNAAVHALK